MTPVRTEAEAVADALIALLVARKLDPTEARQCCDIVGISPTDLTDARIRYDLGRARKPRPVAVLKPVGAEDFSENTRPNDNGAAYKESNGSDTTRSNVAVLPVRTEPDPEPESEWVEHKGEGRCSYCMRWVSEPELGGFARCGDCRRRETERQRQRRQGERERQALERKLMAPIREATTVKLTYDDGGELRLELVCVVCGEPIAGHVGGLVCKGCV